MNGDMQDRQDGVPRAAAFKARVAGMLTAGVVVSLVLAPEALAKLASNHSETVLALD
jgi:hypothetical protein